MSKINFQLRDIVLLVLILAPLYFIGKIYFYTSPDEYYYIFTAIQLAEGKPIGVQLESPLLMGDLVPTTTPNLFISKYPIGQSLFIAIFYLIGGYSFIYYMNGIFSILAAILTYFFVHEISKDRISSLISAILLGICPPMVFYSRTLLSDVPSTTFLLLSFFLYLKASRNNNPSLYVVSSLSLGFATLLKYTNILFLFPILLNQIRVRKLDELSTYLYSIPLIPFFCFIGLYNNYFFGSYFLTGYHLTGEVVYFSVENFLVHFPQYFLVLNLFPPIGLILTFLYIRRKLEEDAYFISLFIILLFLVLFSSYYYLPFYLEHLFIESTRFLIVILPYTCINCVMWFRGRIKKKKIFYCFFLGLFVTLGVINVIMISQYHSFQTRLVYYKDLFYTNTQPASLIIGDDTWDKLFHPYFSRNYGERYYLRYSVLSETKIIEEVLPFVETWIKDKSVYFIDDPYVEASIHDFILQLLTEKYNFLSIITTEQPYTVELFKVSCFTN
ncbi:MAG: ArnT family glycosyltransferase [Promethearchaeota archaeon]